MRGRAQEAESEQELGRVQTIRVLIADGDPAVRRVLQTYLADAGDMRVVGEAGSAREAIEMIERFNLDVALIDFGMAGLGCVEVAGSVEARGEGIGVVVLDTYRVRALELAEARVGGLLKDAFRARLLETIMSAASPSSGGSP